MGLFFGTLLNFESSSNCQSNWLSSKFSHSSIFCLKNSGFLQQTKVRTETVTLAGTMNKRLVGCFRYGLATDFYEDYMKQL